MIDTKRTVDEIQNEISVLQQKLLLNLPFEEQMEILKQINTLLEERTVFYGRK